MVLDEHQRAVVEHEGGPLVVTGGFGSGKTAALQRRAERLREQGRRPLLLHHRDIVDLAIAILGRHGRRVRRSPHPEDADEVMAAMLGFQGSFLGDEELRVHADAAGCLDVAEELIERTARYLARLDAAGLVDDAGAVVQASLLLRDGDVLRAEQARFDELLVDDFQLASFATNRLLSQLAGGPAGSLVVAGHAEAAVAADPLASALHLERFALRFAASSVTLPNAHRVPAQPPELRLLDDAPSGLVIDRADVERWVGEEAPLVVVVGATEGRWPAPRPVHRWFDLELFHGPDLPGEDERDRRWLALERRRFAVATTRATVRTTVLAPPPVTPFVRDLVR